MRTCAAAAAAADQGCQHVLGGVKVALALSVLGAGLQAQVVPRLAAHCAAQFPGTQDARTACREARHASTQHFTHHGLFVGQ